MRKTCPGLGTSASSIPGTPVRAQYHARLLQHVAVVVDPGFVEADRGVDATRSNALSGATPLRSRKFELQLWQIWVQIASVDNRHTLSYSVAWKNGITPLIHRKTLGRERGISFEQVVALIESSRLIQVLEHPNAERYPNQLLYEVEVDGYVHVVPGVRGGRILFLKTIYPSRKATRRRRKGEPA
jgi:hypothetical protein